MEEINDQTEKWKNELRIKWKKKEQERKSYSFMVEKIKIKIQKIAEKKRWKRRWKLKSTTISQFQWNAK